MANDYDFQINSLKFRVATSDKYPYTRSTAPFRKEQFDSARTPGDQSLSGWWVRGQLSFHRGEGVEYYEVLEDDVVLNRFKESLGVLVFTPGELTLDYARTTSALQNVVQWESTGSNNQLFRTSAGAVYYGGAASASLITLNGAVTATCIAGTANSNYWWASTTGDNVQRFFGSSYQRTIYTHTADINVLWYGKERLWIIDNNGAVYAVATDQATPTALSSPICTLTGWNPSKNTSWIETGSAVFVANGNQIWAFTVANDGSVATMTAAISVAVLPPGETISKMFEHMGLITLATESGVRFGTYDGTSITLGPLAVTWGGSRCTGITGMGSKVYVTGWDNVTPVDTDVYTLGYEFDLSSPLEPGVLTYPYRLAFRQQDTSAPISGAIWGGASPTFQPSWYANANVLTRNTNAYRLTSGELYTAQHRLGTLDLKHWHTVTVWARGTQGTVAVYQVENNFSETETLLGTIDLNTGPGLENATYSFTLSPSPSVGLKFVLTTNGTQATGPKLLGYQLKALPMPERQRLIQVPLQVTDFITLKNGTRVGTQGRAYSDMVALEALEESGVVVTFTDHRTGETGTAYVDAVQFQGESPTTFNDNGFGGFAYVTLRVIS